MFSTSQLPKKEILVYDTRTDTSAGQPTISSADWPFNAATGNDAPMEHCEPCGCVLVTAQANKGGY